MGTKASWWEMSVRVWKGGFMASLLLRPMLYLKLWNHIYRPSVPSFSSRRRRRRPLSLRPSVRPIVVVRPLSVRPVVSRRRPLSVRPSHLRRPSSVRPSVRPRQSRRRRVASS